MNRTEFLKLCGILGVGLPMQSALASCQQSMVAPSSFTGKVLIIGAGAGGLSAGYLLKQQGIAFEILEASSQFGGRMRINTTFADFPIPLGAEWLETSPLVFQEIVNDAKVSVNIKTVADDPDRKFVGSSWYSFFEEYIVPAVLPHIRYDHVVSSIDYSDQKIQVNSSKGTFVADKVIVSVPLKILQDKAISFSPSLPVEKLNAIANTNIWEGFKAFFEFSENFYGEGHEYAISPKTDGQKIYYDASLGQNTQKHILGLFVVGKPAQAFLSLSDAALKKYVLSELDALYANKASSKYLKHISQNWNAEPYIRGGYMSDYADWRTIKILGDPVADKLYFAGGAYTDGEDWVSVHTAARSAKVAVGNLLK
jgi:monoamine oxidase